MLNIQTLSFGGLIICLTLLMGLFLLVKLAKLESDFGERQLERKKLQLKRGAIKIIN